MSTIQSKPEQKARCTNISTEHLESYHNDLDFLDKSIAINETWIKSYDPQDAARAREWRYPDEEP
jgi:hypothetical protein